MTTEPLTHIPPEIEDSKWYQLDLDKVKTLEDVKNILRGLDIRVEENGTAYDALKDYLKLDE